MSSSSYTPHQLQAMAQAAVAAHAVDDPRFQLLVLRLALRARMSPPNVVRRLRRLAQTGE